MRIAVLTSLYPSAVRPFEGIFAERRWTGMLRRGHEVSVTHPLPRSPLGFVRSDWGEIARMAPREERSGIRIERPRFVHLPRRALANARAFAACGARRILDAPRPDVVVADYAWPAAAAAERFARERIPFVVSGRGSDVLQVAATPRLRDALARALASAGHWCAVSQDLVDAMDRLGTRRGHGVLVPNGVDLELFAPRERIAARARLGLEARGALVLVVGHLIERKDPLLALRAFAASPLARAAESRIAFVGRGPLEPELRALAKELGLEARVVLAGEAAPDRLVDWYASADVLLLTSSREGRPNVVLEALACGLRVLATDAGGTAEIIGSLDGMLARTREPLELGAMLAAALERAVEPAALRARVAALSWDASLDALEGCLARAVAEAAARGRA